MIPALIGIVCGILLRILPGDRSAWMGRLSASLIYLFYPCLIFTSLLTSYDGPSILRGLVMPLGTFLMLLGGYGVGLLWARRRPEDTPAQRGTLRFGCTVSNYFFLPLLLTDGVWGGEGRAALVLSALGGDIALWVLGVSCFPRGGGGLRGLVNPPIVTLLVSVGLVLSGQTGWALPEVVGALRWPAGLALPVAMTILGYHLAGSTRAQIRRPLAWAMSGLQLLAAPAVVGILLSLLPMDPANERVIFLVSAMPVGMATVYLGQYYGGDHDLASGSVLISHALALVTVPAWMWVWGG